MKKINYILIAAVSALCACSDMNSLHDKYLADGETIYLARFDSVKIYPGKERVKVLYWLSDPKVATTTAMWNMDREAVNTKYIKQLRTIQVVSLSQVWTKEVTVSTSITIMQNMISAPSNTV